VLVEMLRISKTLNIDLLTDGDIDDCETLLDIILLKYCEEIHKLLRHGLIKRYRFEEGNSTSFRGKLVLSKHFAKNHIHAELFYTEHSIYDKNHSANKILLAALSAIPKISSNDHILGLSKTLTWGFPEMEKSSNPTKLFKKIKRDKKLKNYACALELAKLILKGLHPNIYTGTSEAFAMMFDMNLVFERYIAEKLKQSVPNWHIQMQRRGRLWGNDSCEISQKPDIIIKAGTEKLAVLDVKWKSLHTVQDVSSNDLRQVYAYSIYWKTKSAFLLFPAFTKNDFESGRGTYFNHVPCTIAWLQVISSNEDQVKLCEEWVEVLVNDIKTHSSSIPHKI